MGKLKMSINIETEKELDIKDVYIIMQDIKARLEGYVTDVPEQLKDANLIIDENFSIDGVEKNLFTEIKE
ncbi:MAG: hypothetical protein U9Q27_01980 [Patescibacteria group bacterium]|nr:hypothetical protein [Patescibacteria group bacterium]